MYAFRGADRRNVARCALYVYVCMYVCFSSGGRMFHTYTHRPYMHSYTQLTYMHTYVRFEKDFANVQRFILAHNYRSSAHIVMCAQAVIQQSAYRVDKVVLCMYVFMHVCMDAYSYVCTSSYSTKCISSEQGSSVYVCMYACMYGCI